VSAPHRHPCGWSARGVNIGPHRADRTRPGHRPYVVSCNPACQRRGRQTRSSRRPDHFVAEQDTSVRIAAPARCPRTPTRRRADWPPHSPDSTPVRCPALCGFDPIGKSAAALPDDIPPECRDRCPSPHWFNAGNKRGPGAIFSTPMRNKSASPTIIGDRHEE
jgi:hypothetical protein